MTVHRAFRDGNPAGRPPSHLGGQAARVTQVVVPRSTRLLSLAGVVAGATAESLLVPGGARRRQRLQMCTAARVLTALGARVRVVLPPAPWPRAGGLLVTGHDAGRLGDLALLTSVPRSLAGWGELADRVVPVPGPRTPPPAGGTVVCPVTVTCRTADGPLSRLPRRLDEVAALRGLVFDVWLLDAVPSDPAGQLGGAGTGGSTTTAVGGTEGAERVAAA